MTRGERLAVAGFIVGAAFLRAAPEAAQPFEGEAAEDGLVAFAGAFLLEIAGFRRKRPIEDRLGDSKRIG